LSAESCVRRVRVRERGWGNVERRREKTSGRLSIGVTTSDKFVHFARVHEQKERDTTNGQIWQSRLQFGNRAGNHPEATQGNRLTQRDNGTIMGWVSAVTHNSRPRCLNRADFSQCELLLPNPTAARPMCRRCSSPSSTIHTYLWHCVE
jgi:hypothetical protein